MDHPNGTASESNARHDRSADAGSRLREQIEKQLELFRKLCRQSARQVDESRAILAQLVRRRLLRR
ncbi:MAG: hypothetical protein IT428_23000 [Planctomycetaceae bacterium]|nr:hypothetical protein [Planctomycetaceae bacterium]